MELVQSKGAGMRTKKKWADTEKGQFFVQLQVFVSSAQGTRVYAKPCVKRQLGPKTSRNRFTPDDLTGLCKRVQFGS